MARALAAVGARRLKKGDARGLVAHYANRVRRVRRVRRVHRIVLAFVKWLSYYQFLNGTSEELLFQFFL